MTSRECVENQHDTCLTSACECRCHVETFDMYREDVHALVKFFLDSGYISHEHHPQVHIIKNNMMRWLGDEAVDAIMKDRK